MPDSVAFHATAFYTTSLTRFLNAAMSLGEIRKTGGKRKKREEQTRRKSGRAARGRSSCHGRSNEEGWLSKMQDRRKTIVSQLDFRHTNQGSIGYRRPPLICPVAAAVVVLISVTYPMTLVLVFIGLCTQGCEGGKKRAERKRGQNKFSKFHFFSCEVERVPPQVSSKFCTRLVRRLRYRQLVASAELARTGSMGQPGCEHVHICPATARCRQRHRYSDR
jgi:hypothetical protein